MTPVLSPAQCRFNRAKTTHCNGIAEPGQSRGRASPIGGTASGEASAAAGRIPAERRQRRAAAAAGAAGDRVRRPVECRQVERDQRARQSHAARVHEQDAGPHAADQFLPPARRRAARRSAGLRLRRGAAAAQASTGSGFSRATSRRASRSSASCWSSTRGTGSPISTARCSSGYLTSGRPVLLLATKMDKFAASAQREAAARDRARRRGRVSGARGAGGGRAVFGDAPHRHRDGGSRCSPQWLGESAFDAEDPRSGPAPKEEAPRPRGMARGPKYPR